jgi:hypothetical protein
MWPLSSELNSKPKQETINNCDLRYGFLLVSLFYAEDGCNMFSETLVGRDLTTRHYIPEGSTLDSEKWRRHNILSFQ